MKKYIFLFLFFAFGIINVNAEGTICNTSQSAYGFYNMGTSFSPDGSKAWYVTYHLSGPYKPRIVIYDTLCNIVSDTGYIIGDNFESQSNFTPSVYVIRTPYIDYYTYYTRQQSSTTIYVFASILLNKIDGSIMRSRVSQNFPFQYRSLGQSLWIADRQSSGGAYEYLLISMTGATYSLTTSQATFKSTQAKEITCNIGYCIYKTTTGIKTYSDQDQAIYDNINDNTILNWNHYKLVDTYIYGIFGTNFLGTYQYDFAGNSVASFSGRLISNVFQSGGINYARTIDIPYSNSNSFPQYEFSQGGWPSIWTSSGGISYYIRGSTLYTNNTGSILTNLGTSQVNTGNGTGTIDLSFDCDSNHDNEIGIGEALYCPVLVFTSIIGSVNDGISNLYDFITKLKELSPNLTFELIPKANAETGGLFGTLANNQNSLGNNFDGIINYGKYAIILFLALFFLIIMILQTKKN